MKRKDKKIPELKPTDLPLKRSDLIALYNEDGTVKKSLGDINDFFDDPSSIPDNYTISAELDGTTLKFNSNNLGDDFFSVDLSSLGVGDIPTKTSDLINDGNGETQIIFGNVEVPIPFITRADLPNVVPITDYVSKNNGGRFGGPVYVGDIIGGSLDNGVYLEDWRFIVKPFTGGPTNRARAFQVFASGYSSNSNPGDGTYGFNFSVNPINLIPGEDNGTKTSLLKMLYFPDPNQDYFDYTLQETFNGQKDGVNVLQIEQPATVMSIGYGFFGSAMEKGDNLVLRGNAKTGGTHRASQMRILDIQTATTSTKNLTIEADGTVRSAPTIDAVYTIPTGDVTGLIETMVVDGELICNVNVNNPNGFTDGMEIGTLPSYLTYFIGGSVRFYSEDFFATSPIPPNARAQVNLLDSDKIIYRGGPYSGTITFQFRAFYTQERTSTLYE